MFRRSKDKDYQFVQCPTDLSQVMLTNHLVFLLLFASCWLGSEADQCDLFHNGLLCSLDPISNIEGAVFDLESELECQQECDSNINCNHFMFATFNNRPSDCFLLTECNTNTTSCEDTPGCNFSVTGPNTPSITGACCQEFQDVTCEGESEIGHFYDVVEATECQSLCRDTSGCRYWSLYGEICFLYNNCTYPHPCSTICTSGPVFFCESKDVFDTLLLGGDTSSGYLSTSVELITPNMTCTNYQLGGGLVQQQCWDQGYSSAVVLMVQIMQAATALTWIQRTTKDGRRRQAWFLRNMVSAFSQLVTYSLPSEESATEHLSLPLKFSPWKKGGDWMPSLRWGRPSFTTVLLQLDPGCTQLEVMLVVRLQFQTQWRHLTHACCQLMIPLHG